MVNVISRIFLILLGCFLLLISAYHFGAPLEEMYPRYIAGFEFDSKGFHWFWVDKWTPRNFWFGGVVSCLFGLLITLKGLGILKVSYKREKLK